MPKHLWSSGGTRPGRDEVPEPIISTGLDDSDARMT